jgi:hypothetical protein
MLTASGRKETQNAACQPENKVWKYEIFKYQIRNQSRVN